MDNLVSLVVNKNKNKFTPKVVPVRRKAPAVAKPVATVVVSGCADTPTTVEGTAVTSATTTSTVVEQSQMNAHIPAITLDRSMETATRNDTASISTAAPSNATPVQLPPTPPHASTASTPPTAMQVPAEPLHANPIPILPNGDLLRMAVVPPTAISISNPIAIPPSMLVQAPTAVLIPPPSVVPVPIPSVPYTMIPAPSAPAPKPTTAPKAKKLKKIPATITWTATRDDHASTANSDAPAVAEDDAGSDTATPTATATATATASAVKRKRKSAAKKDHPLTEDGEIELAPPDEKITNIMELCESKFRFKGGRPMAKTHKRKSSSDATAPSSSLAGKVVGTIQEDGSVLPSTGQAQEAAPSYSGPRVRIIDGQIVLDEASLQVTVDPTANTDQMERVEETHGERHITSASFMKRDAGGRWSTEETDLFYDGLRCWGTDFEMIARCLFPKRSRHQIKLKFNREERSNPVMVDRALREKKSAKEVRAGMEARKMAAEAELAAATATCTTGVAAASQAAECQQEAHQQDDQNGHLSDDQERASTAAAAAAAVVAEQGHHLFEETVSR